MLTRKQRETSRLQWFVRVELDSGSLNQMEQRGFWGRVAAQDLLRVWKGLPEPPRWVLRQHPEARFAFTMRGWLRWGTDTQRVLAFHSEELGEYRLFAVRGEVVYRDKWQVALIAETRVPLPARSGARAIVQALDTLRKEAGA